jgi:hypothetical protein
LFLAQKWGIILVKYTTFIVNAKGMVMRMISINQSKSRHCIILPLLCLLWSCFSLPAFGQSNEVRSALQELALGNRTNAMNVLLELIIEFPDDPGVVFLHASLLKNNVKAIPMYKKIVKGKPNSEWADDAQFRIISYYATKKDTAKAREEMQKFRNEYPKSEFLPDAYEILRNTVGGSGKNVGVISKQSTDTSNRSLIVTSIDTTKTISKKMVNGQFTLQVGVFKTRVAADEEAQTYTNKRLRCNVIERNMPDGSMRYVVTIGEYTTRKNAEAAVPIVRNQCNCTPLIIQKPQ